MSRAIAIIQARMTSTRLPGKSLLPLAGIPILEHVVRRAQRIPGIECVWVATTNDGSEAPLVDLCLRLGVAFHRGSVEDVLSRYAEVTLNDKADIIMRITADCPFIDPEISQRVLETFARAEGRLSYVSNTLERTYPRGLDVEVFSQQALQTAHREATDPLDREHVTRFFYTHRECFPMGQVTDMSDHSHLRWTVDTSEDYQLARELYDKLYSLKPFFSYKDVLNILTRFPELAQINAQVAQKAEV